MNSFTFTDKTDNFVQTYYSKTWNDMWDYIRTLKRDLGDYVEGVDYEIEVSKHDVEFDDLDGLKQLSWNVYKPIED